MIFDRTRLIEALARMALDLGLEDEARCLERLVDEEEARRHPRAQTNPNCETRNGVAIVNRLKGCVNDRVMAGVYDWVDDVAPKLPRLEIVVEINPRFPIHVLVHLRASRDNGMVAEIRQEIDPMMLEQARFPMVREILEACHRDLIEFLRNGQG